MKTGIYWQDPKYAVGSDRRATDPSLVLYLPLYRLDGASFMSKDAYGHLCTVTGALWIPHGRSFDGVDDYVDCGKPVSLDFTPNVDEFTIEAWIKISPGDTGTVVCKGGASTSTRSYQIYVVGDALWAVIGGQYADSGATVADGEWHHVALVNYDDCGTKKCKFYIDRVADDTIITSGSATEDVNVIIGNNSVLTFPFNGLIDEIRIYNRALTPLEIQRNYLATKRRYR